MVCLDGDVFIIVVDIVLMRKFVIKKMEFVNFVLWDGKMNFVIKVR